MEYYHENTNETGNSNHMHLICSICGGGTEGEEHETVKLGKGFHEKYHGMAMEILGKEKQ